MQKQKPILKWEVLDFRSDVADVNEKIEYMRRALKKWLEE